MIKSLIVLGLVLPIRAQITFSEIMYNPGSSEFHDEFIELYNTSDSTVDLGGWTVGDSSSFDTVIDAGQGTVFLPGTFAVILDGSYRGNSSRYDNIIPPEALIVTIDGNAFLSNGLTNSSPKTLLLKNGNGQVISRYRYETGYEEDHSAEKMVLERENSPDNWGPSLVAGGTPGQRNSISPYDFDLSVKERPVSWSPYLIRIQNSLSVNFYIFNTGLRPFRETVRIRAAFLHPVSETVFDELRRPPEPGDSLLLGFEHIFKRGGRFILRIFLSSDEDENPLNDTLDVEINVLDTDAGFSINEIKFLTRQDEPEWIEILNTGAFRGTLYGWALADMRDTARVDTLVFIDPGQYKLFAANRTVAAFYGIEDSLIIPLKNWPILNNGGDIVYLLDPLERWVEQVPYTTEWLEGREDGKPSLERINSSLDARFARSWGPSTAPEGATPARQNSIFSQPASAGKGSLTVSPDPFSPDNDGFEDYCLISFELPVNSAHARLRIYDLRGRMVRSINEDFFTGRNQTMVWDGRNDEERLLPMGIYIVYLQIIDDRGGVIARYKKSITLARQVD